MRCRGVGSSAVWVMGALLATSSVGCGTISRGIPPGQMVETEPGHGVVVIGVDSPTIVRAVQFQNVEDPAYGIQLAEPNGQNAVQVVGAPAGEYCLYEFKSDSWSAQFPTATKSGCIQVREGESHYAGHLVYLGASADHAFKWETRVDPTCTALSGSHPSVRASLGDCQ